MSNLQDLANQWGREFSKRYGTTCKWVDLHAKQHNMANYQQNKIATKVTNVRYEEKGTAIDVPGTVITDHYINDTIVRSSRALSNTINPQATVFPGH